MKLSLLALLPLATMAFAPVRLSHRVSPSSLVTRNELDDFAEKVVSTTEDYVEKADSLVLSRFMRLADHAPIVYTLKALTDRAGIAISTTGITCNPGAFTGLGTALTVPTWCFNVWALIAVSQVASVAKSALASDGNELSQGDITATAAANWVATRTLGSANPLRDTVLAAAVSGFALRNGNAAGEVTIHNAALQLMSSFTTVLSVLGVVSALSAKIPVISGSSQIISLLGIASYYAMANRAGNGTVKKAVNAGVIAGVLVSAVQGGVSFSFTIGSLLTNAGLLGTAYVAYGAIDRLRNAVFA